MPEKISFKAVDVPLDEVIQAITKQYALNFFYSPTSIPLTRRVTIDVTSKSLSDFLTLLCDQAGIQFTIENGKIILISVDERVTKELFTISGFVADSLTGERLIGATVFFTNIGKFTTTNAYGYYSFTLPKGAFKLRCSYMGYAPAEKEIELKGNKSLNVTLKASVIPISEVRLKARFNDKFSSIKLGQENVPLDIMRSTPSLLGENDVIQFLKMMPGVLSANEASNGLFIRGCTPRQTTFVLDDAPLFNLYHISGWFSTINPDALKDVNLFKSHLPAKAGDALSSMVELRLRDGNNQRFEVTGGIGTITSRLTIEGPIVRDKASFIFSARRSYLDQLLKLIGKEKDIDIGNVYFYDLNLKLNYIINQNNRFYLSGYNSHDFLNQTNGSSWSNKLLSFRWNHLFSGKLFSNLTLTGSNYTHQFEGSDIGSFSYEFTTRIRDYDCKFDFTYYSQSNHKINFGFKSNYQDLMPILYKTDNPEIGNLFKSKAVQNRLIHTLYAESEYDINKHLGISAGLRLTLLYSISSGDQPALLKPQPSMTVRYQFNSYASLKAGYSRNYQFNHGASVFDILIPFERYLFTDAVLKPQYADHFSAGYFQRLGKSGIEMSLEPYYSSMKEQYRFRYGNEIFIGKDYQPLAIRGTGKAYGIEYSLRKLSGRFTGIVNYTLAKVERREAGDIQSSTYNPYYDRRHNLSVSGAFDLSKKVSLSATWIFMSGNPYNLPVAKYEIRGTTVPLYEPGQLYTRRMPAYHRLDLGVQIKFAPHKHYRHSLNFCIYNVYARQNDIYYEYRDILDGNIDKPTDSSVYNQKKFNMVSYYLFQFVPAFSYEFKFF